MIKSAQNCLLNVRNLSSRKLTATSHLMMQGGGRAPPAAEGPSAKGGTVRSTAATKGGHDRGKSSVSLRW